MSAFTTLGTTPRGASPRLRRYRNATKPAAQLNLDELSIQRLRIRTGKFPTSFSETSSLRSEVRSKGSYYSVIAAAVSRLPNNTRDARLALYDLAEVTLTAELLNCPEISDEQMAVERLALERAMRKIEDGLRKKDRPKRAVQRPLSSFLSFIRSFRRSVEPDRAGDHPPS
jgi:hypothetical protein